jgi:hypothetical protein
MNQRKGHRMNNSESKNIKDRWTVVLEEDGDDLLLPLPPEVLLHLDAKEGDVLEWLVDDQTGQITIKKKKLKLHERVLHLLKNMVKSKK